MHDKNKKIECQFCEQKIYPFNKERHESTCYLNPTNLRQCEICGNPIKRWQDSKGTCSRSCANTAFRTGENHGNWKNDRYRTTCFEHHEKKCVCCDEQNIVTVHHLDHNRKNNDPSNLVPLCPTHHQYWHSRFRTLIEQQVLDYIERWKQSNGA